MTKRRPQKPAYLLSAELQSARAARRLHSEDCPYWDYEQTNCIDCDRHDENVRTMRRRLDEARAWERG